MVVEKFRFIAVFVLVLAAGCSRKSDESAPTPESSGKAKVTFSGAVGRQTDYGARAGTNVFCSYNPKWEHYLIELKENGPHKDGDGISLSVFGTPGEVRSLEAGAWSSSISVKMKDIDDATDAAFGRKGEWCSVSLTAQADSLAGSFECTHLSNGRGQTISITGTFDCGSVYVWK